VEAGRRLKPHSWGAALVARRFIAGRGWAALVLSLLLALLTGCSGAPAPATAAHRPPAAKEDTPSTPGSPSAIVPGRLMVTLPPAPPDLWNRTTAELEQAHRLRTVFAWTMESLGERCIVFEVPNKRSVAEVIRHLHSDPRVGSAQPIATFDVLAAEPGYNDPYSHLQHDIQALHLEQAHRWATGKGVKVAVIDTGADFDHPDLRGRIVKANSFVDRGDQAFTSDIHGTAVAGVIAANANNQVGIVGVAPQAELLILKACWQKAPGQREAVCDSYTLAQAIDFAILQRAQVLNFSLGGPYDPLLARLLTTALSRGIAVVAADAGDGTHSFPASLQGVIGILGIDDLRGERKVRAPAASNEMGAPAVDILTTVPHGSYDFFSGSSFAAAQVSGIVALLLEREPKMTPAQIAALLRKTSRMVQEASGADPLQVDACAALAGALGTGTCP
jgi:major intracellular serine protease